MVISIVMLVLFIMFLIELEVNMEMIVLGLFASAFFGITTYVLIWLFDIF